MDLQLQKALFDLFESRLKIPFYDGSRNEGYPYGAFGYTEDNTLDTKTTKGNEVFYQIDLFSDYNGQKEVKELAQEVKELLSGDLILESGRVAYLSDFTKRIQREDEVYHGIIEVTFKIY